MHLTFEIRPEALWDNGDSITAKDVEFSVKVIKNPKVMAHRFRPYYEFIQDIIFYEDNPRKFTFVSNQIYFMAEEAAGDLAILPRYIYDPDGIMENFSIPELTNNARRLQNDPRIIAFANDYNSERYQREAEFIVGSGPYAFVEWQTGRRIILVKKLHWWGQNIKNASHWFDAYPEEIRFEIINDFTTALVAMKSGKIDVIRGVPPKDFVKLPESNKFTDNFNTHSPNQLAYYYIGMNTKNPKFRDVRVRKALAHLIDVDKIIETVMYGLATRVAANIHPSNKAYYNDTLSFYQYDLEKSKSLLSEAGWHDSNGDGTLDKIINGELVNFTIEYIYNQANEQRKAIGLIFQEEARKVGIEVNVITQDWGVFLKNIKGHNYEMCCSAWGSSPLPLDLKQIWHTSSIAGGDNNSQFGTIATDAIIESARFELEEEKRIHYYWRFQEELRNQVPYIFLFVPQERMAFHKRFVDASATIVRPGYFEPGFQLVQSSLAE